MRRIIYGSGVYGKWLLDYFRNNGIHVDAYCQTSAAINCVQDGIPVISLNNLSLNSGDIVYISMRDLESAYSVKNDLEIKFFGKVNIYIMSDFVQRNYLRNQVSGYCLCCKQDVKEFLPGGVDSSIFRRFHIVGGGLRDNYLCPSCHSNDRERWLLYVLSSIFTFSSNDKVLHFAPEASVKKYLETKICDYYSCDISVGRAAHIVDVTDIQFKNDTFDLIIINHVLEHILDEQRALGELKRVLKPSGVIIMSFPICMDQETYENHEIVTPEARLAEYGQEDHVRLYGTDFMQRLEKNGFDVIVYRPQDYFDEEAIQHFGFLGEDMLLICSLSK